MWRFLIMTLAVSVGADLLLISGVDAIPVGSMITNYTPKNNNRYHHKQKVIIQGQNFQRFGYPNGSFSQTVIINPSDNKQIIVIPGNNVRTIIVNPSNGYYNQGDNQYNGYNPGYNNGYNNGYNQIRNCTTLIPGSPIPSPVPIDSVTGKFCN
jgi:hypothetical protein